MAISRRQTISYGQTPPENMKDLLVYLAKNLVAKPEAVEVTETQEEQGIVNLELSVDSADMGKVIGKEGRIIRALRDLVKVLAIKQNSRVNVVLREE